MEGAVNISKFGYDNSEFGGGGGGGVMTNKEAGGEGNGNSEFGEAEGVAKSRTLEFRKGDWRRRHLGEGRGSKLSSPHLTGRNGTALKI